MDLQYLLLLQKFRDATGGALNDFFLQISDLSYGIFIWMLACILFWAVDKKSGAFLFLNIAVSRFLMQLLKLTFCVYRPWIRDPGIVPVETASGYSFPSGHSVTGASNYGTVLARYGKKHRPLGAFMAVMLLLTMFSRNYIGVHTPQDVAVGAALGLAVAFLGLRAWAWIDAKPGREKLVPLVGAALTALFLVYISVKSYPMDYDEAGKLLVDPAKMMKDGYKDAGRLLGVSLGWYLERRYVRFSTDVSALTKVTRCGVGVLLLMVYEQAFMPAVTGAVSLGWIGFALTCGELLLLMVIYPLCFSRLEALGSGKPQKEARPAGGR